MIRIPIFTQLEQFKPIPKMSSLSEIKLKRKVLIVDDDILIRYAIRLFLEKEKCFEISESNNEEAIHLLQNQSFDFLLVDIEEEKSKGVKLINTIRSKRHSVPIFVISSLDKPKIKKIIPFGLTHVIERPFSMSSLIKVLKEKISSN